jgi:hypothetical protein
VDPSVSTSIKDNAATATMEPRTVKDFRFDLKNDAIMLCQEVRASVQISSDDNSRSRTFEAGYTSFTRPGSMGRSLTWV